MKYKCINCGQDFLLDTPVKATECPNCGSHDFQVQISYASFWRRTGAFLADFFLWYLVPMPLLLLAGDNTSSPFATVVGIAGTGWLLLIPIFIYIIAPFIWRGQTPGKRILGIVVVNKDGGTLTWWQVILRVPMYFASYLPILLGFFWCIWDKEKRCFHDMILRTRVIYTKDREAMVEAVQHQQTILETALSSSARMPSLESIEAIPARVDVTVRFPAKWVEASPKNVVPHFIPRRRGNIEISKDRVAFQGWVNRGSGWLVAGMLVLLPISYAIGNAAGHDSYGNQTTPVFCVAPFFFVGGIALWQVILDFGFAISDTVSLQNSSIKDMRIDAVKRTITITSAGRGYQSQVIWTIQPDQLEKVAQAIQQRINAQKADERARVFNNTNCRRPLIVTCYKPKRRKIMKKPIMVVLPTFLFLMILISGCATASTPTPIPPPSTPSPIPPASWPLDTGYVTPATRKPSSPYQIQTDKTDWEIYGGDSVNGYSGNGDVEYKDSKSLALVLAQSLPTAPHLKLP